MKIEISAGLLQTGLIVLKLAEVITWSWKWVLAPTWVPLAIGVALAIAALVVTTLRDH